MRPGLRYASRAPLRVILVALAAWTIRCTSPLELCLPTETRFGFFSQGDCDLTNATFFRGHEWLSYFGNKDLLNDDRFTEDEIRQIADGKVDGCAASARRRRRPSLARPRARRDQSLGAAGRAAFQPRFLSALTWT